MYNSLNKHNLFYRICSVGLIILHLATFGPIREALAFYAQSASYKLNSGTLNEGGRGRGGGSYTKLLLHADGAAGSTTFTDETGKTVTAQGSAQIDTAQNKFSGASGLFNGGVNIQATIDNSNQVLGDISNAEARQAQSFQSSSAVTVLAAEIKHKTTNGAPTGNWTLRIETDSGGFPSGLLVEANATVTVSPPGAGNTVKGTFPSAIALSANTKYHLVVQCDNQATNDYWEIAAASSSVYADGTKEISTNGIWEANPNHDLWFILYLSPAYLSTPDSVDWNFENGDFTIDLWVRFAVASGQGSYTGISQNVAGSGSTNYFMFRITPSDYILDFGINGGGRILYSAGPWPSSLSINTWYHIAVVRTSTSVKWYVNGIDQNATVQQNDGTYDCSGLLRIGAIIYEDHPEWNAYLNGWLDEVRISKGIARWTANFIPPAQPYSLDNDAIPNSSKLWQDTLGEPAIGKSISASFILNSGFIPTIQSSPPILTQGIPYQTWAMNTSKDNAFDLDDYFTSPDGYTLTYTVSGNSNINVDIDPTTHLVSFSQAQDWFGVEKVYFTAQDTEGATMLSNEVVLQVANASGQPNKPVIVYTALSPASLNEGDLVTLTVKAYDLDNQDLTFSYSDFFSQTRRWKEGNYWYSEATWQTGANSTGHYTIRITVSDGVLTDTSSAVINIGNLNHPPVLNPISDITANEGDLVVITPSATDSDNDAITFYYSAPFDTQGKWLTDYDDAGTYNIKVIASDGIDTVAQSAKVIINNTNRAPLVTLTLSKYTVRPNEEFSVTLSATDPDGDSMTFSLKKDGSEIASGSITSTYNTTTSFSTLGDHTISATVTDSGGKSSTDSKGVDVADPNANRDSINPVMGDFNGDALSDLGLHNSDSGTWEICISDAGVFRNAVDWLNGFGTSRDWWPIGGDFNGDAKTDIGIYNNSTGELKIALSQGSGFGVQGTWLTFPNASYSWQPTTGNFNADKYTDFALYNKDTGEVKVSLGTGTGFGGFNTWLTGFGTNYIALAGDFNADSLTDICLFQKSSGEFKVAFSNSKAFVDGASWISGFAVDKDPLISDFNNDGLADIGYWDKAGFKWSSAISTGVRFLDKGLWLDNFGTTQDESATTGDFDGNGLTDAACFDKDQLGINRWTTRLSTDKPADLLTEVDNGIGGKTQITYTYAAKSDNALLPFPVYVASSTSLINTFPADRLATYTQEFIFSGGYYDATEREFRGFAKVKVTDPITNNYSETYFYQGKPGQDGALKGQIEKIISFDGNARKISETLNTYEVRKAGPESRMLGFPALIEQTTTVWEENATYLATKDKFTYDNIGNLLEQAGEGDSSKLGDEKSAATTYAQAYEVGFNRPLETALKDKDGNVVSNKSFEYDSKGNLIKDTVEIFNPLTSVVSHPSSLYSYDSFGNLTSTANALGSTVTTDYETAFYTYPEKITNSLGHTIQYVYEPKFGVVKSVTDANGSTSSTTYDSLGRPLVVKNAYNQIVTTYTYPDFNTKITTNALNLTLSQYIDGLGRKYKTVSSGEDGNLARQVTSEVFYNNRGQVEKESLPHYIDEDPAQISYIRYEYDIRGRVKKTISDFPGTLKDAESSVNYLNPLYTESTDPLGHKKAVKKDVYGNILEVIEIGIYHTYYAYDTQNNLSKTTDNQGNITQIFYDSIGRKIKMLDPDMGTWTYEYDLIGNLKKQTDAKGQVLEFQYDVLNRLTAKQGLSPQGTVPVLYFYDDAAKANCIGRLSKVTDQSGSTEFFYDKLGREIKSVKSVESIAYSVERSYDILDRLVTLKYPDSETITYTYDTNSGLLEKVQGLSPSASEGTVPYVTDITYNAKGQIKTISYGNNTSTNYTYGQDLRLSNILTRSPANPQTLQDLNYIFDKNGNLITLTDNLRSNIRSFLYDGLDRLTEASNLPAPGGGYTTFNYQYDSIGNMTYKSDVGVMSYGEGLSPQGTVPKPHALTSAAGYTYRYDANGNMTVGKNKTLAYDAENRLLEVNELGIITSFIYDGDGGRVKKATSSSSTIYIGSLFEIQSVDHSPKSVVKHIFAGSQRICSITTDYGLSTTDYHYYHSDHLGSSNIITDSSGQQVQYCEYTPYGTLSRNEGTDIAKHKFTGKELDSTGLYFYGARYYDPEIGRFITADTIVQAPYDPQSLNRYSYCRNNPINYIDPSGNWWWFIALIIKFAVAHPVIFGAILGATMNTAFNASNIHNFGNFMAFAAIGAIGGAAGGGVGTGVGSAFGAFWGTLAGGAAGGFVGGFGNASYAGASFGQALAFGGISSAIAVGTSAVLYGGAKVAEKVIGAIKNASAARANASGTKTPIGQQGKGSAASTLNANKGESVSKSQALSEGKEIKSRIRIEVRDADIEKGSKVYRVWGDESGPNGRSWTTTNPETVPNFRSEAGLPPQNTGRFVTEGKLLDTTGVTSKAAEPLYGNPGGLNEVVIPDPKNQVQIERVSGANPEY